MQNIVPFEVDVGIAALGVIVASRVDNEAVVRMHVSADVLMIGIHCIVLPDLTSLCPQRGSQILDPKWEFGGSYDGHRSHVGDDTVDEAARKSS